jgi:hypothetical protein
MPAPAQLVRSIYTTLLQVGSAAGTYVPNLLLFHLRQPLKGWHLNRSSSVMEPLRLMSIF